MHSKGIFHLFALVGSAHASAVAKPELFDFRQACELAVSLNETSESLLRHSFIVQDTAFQQPEWSTVGRTCEARLSHQLFVVQASEPVGPAIAVCLPSACATVGMPDEAASLFRARGWLSTPNRPEAAQLKFGTVTVPALQAEACWASCPECASVPELKSKSCALKAAANRARQAGEPWPRFGSHPHEDQ